MNKPEPMTADEIWASDKIMKVNASLELNFNQLFKLTQAVIAERDAQWEQMLAGQEPVAYQSMHCGIPVSETHNKAEADKWVAAGVTVRNLYTTPPDHTAAIEQALGTLRVARFATPPAQRSTFDTAIAALEAALGKGGA